MTTNGEADLKTLLAGMQPVLDEIPYVFCSVDRDVFATLPFEPQGTFVEAEGITIIAQQEQAREYGLPYDKTWARITLTVHSSLTVVGFLAAITGKLAGAGISVNPVSAYYHDHLFVLWEERAQSLQALRDLSELR